MFTNRKLTTRTGRQPDRSSGWHVAAAAAVIVLAGLAWPAAANAATTISQGFTTSDKLSAGSIVSLENNSSDKVVGAGSNNVVNIYGVVINDSSSLLSLSSDGQANQQTSQVQVATSGIVQVLVSDINGKITQGDSITASPIKGVGMKATDSVKVIGLAQGDLTSNASKQTYKDKAGAEHSVTVGQIPVLLNVSYYFKQPEKTLIPMAVQNIANALAGRNVKPVPIIISLVIFCIALILVISIVFSMIRSSIISIGRNPMAQSAVYRNLMQLSAIVLAILGVAVGTIYMVLTKL